MSNVLFLLGSFYPRASANGNCVWRIAESLQKRGDKVFCICEGQNNKKKEMVSGVEIHYIKGYRQDRMREKGFFCKGIKRRFYVFLERLCAYYRTITTIKHFPVTKKVADEYYQTIEEICNENQIDILIPVNKPVDAVCAAVKYKQNNPSVRLISYMLDLVYGGHYNPLLSKLTERQRCIETEEQIILHSDKVIALEEHEKQYTHEHPSASEDKIYYLGVPLLTDNTRRNPDNNSSGKHTIVYAGSVDERLRNPLFVAKVFKYIKNAELVMYITDGLEYMESIAKGIANISIKSRVDATKLKQIYNQADAFLNIGNATTKQSPSKIIEFIGYGKPIISTYRIDHDTSAAILKDYPNALCIDERSESEKGAALQIDSFIEHTRPISDFDEIKEKYSRYTPDAFIDLVMN